MKNIIILSFVFITVLGYAQKSEKRADSFFEKMWYREAAKEYEAIISKGEPSMEMLQKAGDSYFFNTDMKQAHRWYELLVSEYYEEVAAEYLFRYAHTLGGIGDYKEAKKWMIRFSKRAEEKDSRKKEYAQEDFTIDDLLVQEPQFQLKNLSINTEFSDFAPMYYKDSLVYSSVGDTSYFHSRKYHWNEQPFLSLYKGSINALQTDVKKHRQFSEDLNTKYHEAAVAFSPDQKKIYFTRNNYDGKLGRDEKGVSHLKLYSADYIAYGDGGVHWENSKELPFNSENYSVGHPAVSVDGSKLYFVSDMPGTIGATDIFVVTILGNDEYSEPKNLGPKINTPGREMFPYITEFALYFASDGHLGLGGLDVFESNNGISFDTPINLGAPLNNNMDDFAYIVNEQTHKGFVCSNRISGKGDDDIYSFERFEIVCEQSLEGKVVDEKTAIPLSEVDVTLFNYTGVLIEKVKTGLDGTFLFSNNITCEREYRIEIGKEKYKNNSASFLASEENVKRNILTFTLEKKLNELIISENGILKINISNIFFDSGKHVIKKDAAVELDKVVSVMNEYPEMIIKIESHTDSRGRDGYNLSLSKRRAKSTSEYIISQGILSSRIESATGFGEKELLNRCTNGISCTDEEHNENRRSEFIIVKM